MNLRRARRGALTLTLAALALASPAAAKVHLRLSPRAPIVDDTVTVSWRTDRALRPGYHYRAEISAPFGDDCARTVTHTSRRARRKGETVRLDFSPYDEALTAGKKLLTDWCWGKAYATVDIVSDRGHAPIGEAAFHFKAKP